jgi:hypothetical protein
MGATVAIGEGKVTEQSIKQQILCRRDTGRGRRRIGERETIIIIVRAPKEDIPAWSPESHPARR